jgi:ergothioneine biosynthesis protein EgtB
MKSDLKLYFLNTRKNTEKICLGLSEEELSLQPRAEVSPAKWHLGHTTWFFEKMILTKYDPSYETFNKNYDYIFNSYYKQVGEHLNQGERGNIDPCSVEILEYRDYVSNHLSILLENMNDEVEKLVEVGIAHEQQHQELLHMDLKAVFDKFGKDYKLEIKEKKQSKEWFHIPEGIIECGLDSDKFSFDNESPRHKYYQYSALIKTNLVTNGEFSEFINAEGYKNPKYWLSKGWEWVKENEIEKPLYWNESTEAMSPVSHISYYEADAYANWAGLRLPTEQEHEFFDQAIEQPNALWSWTSSQYCAYPGFKKFSGELSEYNGKFMCNQFVLRGGCSATPNGHWRSTYRNFYEPHQRWMFSGIRLATDNK